jgi:hypothetical protein
MGFLRRKAVFFPVLLLVALASWRAGAEPPPDEAAARARMNEYLRDLSKAESQEQREQALERHGQALPPEVQKEERAHLQLLQQALHGGGPVAAPAAGAEKTK